MAQIFISYKRGSVPDCELARRLRLELNRLGWEVWIDQLIPGGDNIGIIEREIEDAACVVVIWSNAARSSEWVRAELSRAARLDKAIPVYFESEAVSQRPIVAEHLNFIDLSTWNGQPNHGGLAQLLRSIESKVLTSEEMTAEEVETPHPGSPKKPRSEASIHLSRILDASRAPELWKTNEFIRNVKAAPITVHDTLARTILGEVRPDRSLNELAALHMANEHLQFPIDRKAFFSACGRWPPPALALGMRLVPDGTYSIGSPSSEPNRCDDEHLQKVNLTAFLLSSTPITNSQFLTFSPDHPLREWADLTDEELRDHPAVRVTWWEAYLFCAWLGGSLPSEAQWEAACRAGSNAAYSNGHTIDRHHANFDCGTTQALRRTAPVGSQGSANAFGLFDMHGNVWEWCLDTYDADFFLQVQAEDPVCKRPSAYRIARGGCWNAPAHALRSAFRNRIQPDSRLDNMGFRVAFPANR